MLYVKKKGQKSTRVTSTEALPASFPHFLPPTGRLRVTHCSLGIWNTNQFSSSSSAPFSGWSVPSASDYQGQTSIFLSVLSISKLSSECQVNFSPFPPGGPWKAFSDSTMLGQELVGVGSLAVPGPAQGPSDPAPGTVLNYSQPTRMPRHM